MIGMTHEQEVKVQTRGPDGGNPTLMRQGLRATEGPVEAVGAWPSRARAKRRKAYEVGRAGPWRLTQFPSEPVRMGDGMVTKFVESYPVRSAGPRAQARKLGGRKDEER